MYRKCSGKLIFLTHWYALSYRNQSIDLQSKPIDWFLYGGVYQVVRNSFSENFLYIWNGWSLISNSGITYEFWWRQFGLWCGPCLWTKKTCNFNKSWPHDNNSLKHSSLLDFRNKLWYLADSIDIKFGYATIFDWIYLTKKW